MDRLYRTLLEESLRLFPCVALIGPRQCGKTTLARMLPGGWRHFDLERVSDFNLIAGDPDLFLRLYPDKVAVDEAQLLPELFAALRVAVDHDRGRVGRFVLTGSSSPALRQSIWESLAGRVALIEMSPLMWAEVAGEGVCPLFRELVAQGGGLEPGDVVKCLAPRGTLEDAQQYWFRGGYPEPWRRDSKVFSRRWTDQYVARYLNRDVAQLFPKLDPGQKGFCGPRKHRSETKIQNLLQNVLHFPSQ